MLFAFIALAFSVNTANAADPRKESTSTADHTEFEELQQAFETGADVTKACLSCHTEASKQIYKTTHGNWMITHPDDRPGIW